MSVVSLIVALPFLLIGLHLIRVAARSGAIPERLLSGFFLLAGIGAVPRIAAIDMLTEGHGASWTTFWLNTAANVAIGSALVCLAAFAWKVFRRDEAWARTLVGGFAAVLAAVSLAGASSVQASGGANPVSIAFNALGAGVLAWTFVECFQYRRLLRRRLALGLADPVVANRFFLWALWTGGICLQATTTSVLRLALWWTGAGERISAGLDPGGHWVLSIGLAKGLIAVVGPIAVVAVFLSFSPPARYLRWLGSEPGGAEPVEKSPGATAALP